MTDGEPAGAQADAGQNEYRHRAQDQTDDTPEVEGKADGLDVPGQDERPSNGEHGNAQRNGGLGQADDICEQAASQINRETLQKEGDAGDESGASESAHECSCRRGSAGQC